MIIVTGAAGFISGHLVKKLNELNYKDLVLVDDFSFENKKLNYTSAQFKLLVDRKDFIDWLNENHRMVQMVIHLGARTDTTEFNRDIFNELNLNYSKAIWHACVEFALPLIYASSAATYGLGEYGYEDNHDIVPKLKPLNPYGDSKNDFDIWALQQDKKPFFWAGLKFFNVYGPWENHKGRMASVIFHAFNQIKDTGLVKLFKSHRPDFNDGEQLRDFVYVKDVVKVIGWMLHEMFAQHWGKEKNGLYNLGTGQARSFYDLAANTFTAQSLQPNIEFIDMPHDIRDKYQYFTEANMNKLRAAGYTAPFSSLEEGVGDYVKNYLFPEKGY